MNRFLQYVLLISSLLLIPSMASAVLLEEEPRLTFMWKVHGLYLAEVRVLLLGDGDLGGTVRQSAKDRTLYEASGKLQAYTKVASDRVELYNAKNQWIGDIFVSPDAPAPTEEDTTPAPTWTITGNVGRGLGTITKTDTGYEYRDETGRLIGTSTLEAKALILTPPAN